MHTWLGSWCPFTNFSYGGIIMMIIGFIPIAVIVYILLRRDGKNTFSSNVQNLDDPIEILKRRFAEGQITEEEFRQMKIELSTNK